MIERLRGRTRGRLLWLKNPLYRAWRGLAGPRLPVDWRRLLREERDLWQSARRAGRNGPQVLLGTTLGWYPVWHGVDTMLAAALTLRGARVQALLCDRQLSGCMPWVYAERQGQPPGYDPPGGELCERCFPPSWHSFRALGLPVQRYSRLIRPAERAEAERLAAAVRLSALSDFSWHGIAIGEHALAGAIRFYGNTDVAREPEGEAVARRYLASALLVAFAVERLLGEHGFAVACGSHGIYVPQGLLGEIARRRGVRVVNWHPAYRNQCLLFSEGNTYHKTMLDEPVAAWEQMDWDAAREAEIMAYLESRQHGSTDWIAFNRDPARDSLEQLRALGVDLDRPCIGLLTNVAWDAQLHYGASPFKDMLDWLVQTVAYFARRPELQLIIRVHPAELKGHVVSRQPALAELARHFDPLPPNVFAIPPESAISTYDTMAQCNAVIIYATKTGIELAARGIPVITAGEAWIKNKGFALDAGSREEYVALLERLPLPSRLSSEATRRARMYAYHFFLRRMIPVPFFYSLKDISVRRLSDLLPGKSLGLDVICDGILNGSPFIYPAETLAAAEPAPVAAGGAS